MTNGREAESTRNQIINMEKEVKSCNPNVIRLIRTATINNINAKKAGQINDIIALKNDERIYTTTETFIRECLCVKKSLGI